MGRERLTQAHGACMEAASIPLHAESDILAVGHRLPPSSFSSELNSLTEFFFFLFF